MRSSDMQYTEYATFKIVISKPDFDSRIDEAELSKDIHDVLKYELKMWMLEKLRGSGLLFDISEEGEAEAVFRH